MSLEHSFSRTDNALFFGEAKTEPMALVLSEAILFTTPTVVRLTLGSASTQSPN